MVPLLSLSALGFRCPQLPSPNSQQPAIAQAGCSAITSHLHKSAGQMSPCSSLLHQLRSFQPQEMIFPESLPPLLLEASAQVIQPPKTLTSILLTVGEKGAPNAAFSIILHPSPSPVQPLQVLKLSIRSPISSPCFSQRH